MKAAPARDLRGLWLELDLVTPGDTPRERLASRRLGHRGGALRAPHLVDQLVQLATHRSALRLSQLLEGRL